MAIVYKTGVVPGTQDVIEVYNSSGINRPTADFARIEKMYKHSNLIITAWDGNKLVGVARSLTDFCYCCYLSDLAVRKDYQTKGVGRQLIGLTQEAIGPQCMLLLLAAATATEYYPKVGFDKAGNAFMIKRQQ